MVIEAGSHELVWYVAYGSNLCAERFACYVRGGMPTAGAGWQRGCRDPAPPRDDRPVRLDHPLFFAGRSRVWGGGVAFCHPDPSAGAGTLGRAWLVTRRQLEGVVAQERHRDPVPIDPCEVARHGRLELGPGPYGLLVALPPLDGIAAVTCTAAPATSDPPGPVPAAPRPAYLATIARGLAEAHGLRAGEAAAYLRAARPPGTPRRRPGRPLSQARRSMG